MRISTMEEIHLHVIDIFIAKYVMMKYKEKKTRQKNLEHNTQYPSKTHTDVVASTEKRILLGFHLSVMMRFNYY